MNFKNILLGWLMVTIPFVVCLIYLRYDLWQIILVSSFFGTFIAFGTIIVIKGGNICKK